MSRLTLDATLPEKLRTARETVAICDDAGRQLGVYTPTDPEARAKQERVVAYLKTKITSEDLRQHEAEPGPNKTWEQLKKEMGANGLHS